MIEEIQESLRASGLDAWLFFDHHRRDPLAYRILRIPQTVTATRRWYYLVPAQGEPRKLVHRIESGSLDSLPGAKETYSSWSEQQHKLAVLLAGCSHIAMQYSPRNAIPYVSLVDAGTIETVRAVGVEVVSSADMIQEFEARWTQAQFDQHVAAGKLVDRVRREAFDLIGERLRSTTPVTEYEDHGPIVAVNANASNPHYEPTRESSSPIKEGDLVLIDLWAKLAEPNSVYYDVTWTGFCGESIPSPIQNVFEAVRDARKAASDFVLRQIAAGQKTAGFEVDDQARRLIEQRGYGPFFLHRTGHSIGTEVHGTGANMDNLESHDERLLIPRTAFSIEPGVYLEDFGIRSEVNVWVGEGFARVTGEEQEQLTRI